MNKIILDRLGIIILIIKEFICILENKYIYSNIKVRVKLQAGIKPVKGGGAGGDDDGGGGVVEMMMMVALAWWERAPARRPVLAWWSLLLFLLILSLPLWW
jgi:hypothetical protein